MATTLTPKKVNQLTTSDALMEYSSTTGERERFASPVAVVLVVRQSGSGDDGNYFVQLANDGNTPHNFVARANDTVIVSTSSADQVEVTNVIGETTAAATTALEADDFVVDPQEINTDDADDGTVMIQVPAAGTMADSGSTVTIYSAVAIPAP